MRAALFWASVALMGSSVLMAQKGAAPWFSTTQVKSGQTLVLQQCAACHGAQLEGRYGPPLSGARFTDRWRGRKGKELQLFISQNMPLGRAGHLSQTQILELIAFILHSNGYPSGEQDLTPQSLEQLVLFQP